MQVKALEVERVRVVSAARLEFRDGMNVLVGQNGSGKTSILECLHILSTGRSFRVRGARDVIQRGQESLTVFGELRGDEGRVQTVGVEKGLSKTRMRVGGEDVGSASVLARWLPLTVVTPDCQRLLTDGAELRRRLVDWLLFHVEPEYMGVHVEYRRALRQRNELLRRGTGGAEFVVWSDRVAEAGEQLHKLRLERLSKVLPRWGGIVREMLPLQVDISYQRGWSQDMSFAEALSAKADDDRRRGYTGIGPHRADLGLRVDKAPAHHILSRGEGKLFAASLIIGQAAYFAEHKGTRPVILVDDLSSELDAESRARFFNALWSVGAQVVVTTVAEDLVLPFVRGNCRMFHVEQGDIKQVL